MSYEKVSDLSTDVVVKIGGTNSKTGKPEPKQMEGFYLGFRNVTTQNGEAKIHTFQTSKGNVGAWGTKDLNDKLGQVKPGTMTLVEYTGKKKLQGGKTLHTYVVSQDKSNTLDIENLAVGYATAGEEVGYDDDTYEAQLAGADDEAELEAAALIEAERMSAQKAKVQEILNRGKQKKA